KSPSAILVHAPLTRLIAHNALADTPKMLLSLSMAMSMMLFGQPVNGPTSDTTLLVGSSRHKCCGPWPYTSKRSGWLPPLPLPPTPMKPPPAPVLVAAEPPVAPAPSSLPSSKPVLPPPATQLQTSVLTPQRPNNAEERRFITAT